MAAKTFVSMLVAEVMFPASSLVAAAADDRDDDDGDDDDDDDGGGTDADHAAALYGSQQQIDHLNSMEAASSCWLLYCRFASMNTAAPVAATACTQ